MANRANKTRHVALRLPAKMVADIDCIARESRVFTRTDIVRFLLDRGLRADLARELIDSDVRVAS